MGKKKLEDNNKIITRNKKEDLFPENISPYSHQQVWWECENDHVWKSSVKQRINLNKACPECAYLKKLKEIEE